MKFIEITVLEQLSPEDHLLYMQEVWAQVTELTPERLGVQASFHEFCTKLNELESLVVKELKQENLLSGNKDSNIGILLRMEVDRAYEFLLAEKNRCCSTDFSI